MFNPNFPGFPGGFFDLSGAGVNMNNPQLLGLLSNANSLQISVSEIETFLQEEQEDRLHFNEYIATADLVQG